MRRFLREGEHAGRDSPSWARAGGVRTRLYSNSLVIVMVATLQNWQSEFLAVGSMAVLSIYLRQRGSPESKPVGAPHDATGVEG